ncbi:MAG: hypothetical protein IJB34_06205 [Clostridia bacterium]|nr:hypothetical protein [Clostridia bacterium]
MLFRNAFRLLTENFKSVYRILLYKIVVSLIATALCCALILPELLEVWNAEQTQRLLADGKAFFEALLAVDGDSTVIKDEILGEGGSLRAFALLLSSKTTAFTLVAIGCIVVYLLRRFVETLCYFTTGSMLGDRMNTYSDTPFFAAFVANLGKASLYALVYVPVVFLFDAITVGLVLLIFAVLATVPAITVSITLVAILQALKLTLTGYWMPAMTTDGKRISQVFRSMDKTEKKQGLKIFSTYVVSVYLVIVVNVVAATATFGSALLLTVPASFMLFICQQYVHYYTLKGKKYFITFDTIAVNPDKGDREHFFDYIDETDVTKQGVLPVEERDSSEENTK